MTYKRASFQLLTVFTGILCFIAILLSTPWGAQLSFFVINKVSPITLEYQSGALLNNLQLKKITLNNETTTVNVKGIRLQLHLRCLWRKQLCIDELSIASVNVNLKNSQANTPDQLAEDIVIPAFYQLPLSLTMQQFSLTHLYIKNERVALQIKDIASALSINKTVIELGKTNIDSIGIQLIENNTAMQPIATQPIVAKNTNSTAKNTWPLATLPNVYLPYQLTVNSLMVNHINVYEASVTDEKSTLLHVKNSEVDIQWFETSLKLNNLSSSVLTASNSTFIGHLAVTGKVDFIAPYSLNMEITTDIEQSEMAPQLAQSNQQIVLQGELANLTLTAISEGALALNANATIDITNKNIPHHLTVEISKVTLPSAVTDVIQPAYFTLQSDGNLLQQTLTVNSQFSGLGYQNIKLDLAAKLKNQVLDIERLYLEDEAQKNNLDITGEVHLAEKLSWLVNVTSSGMTLPALNKRLTGRLQGNIQSAGYWHNPSPSKTAKWAFNLKNSAITGTVNQIELTAKANVDINYKGELSPSNLVLNYGDIDLNLNGYSDENWHVAGLATIGNMGLWVKELDGAMKANIQVSGLVKQPKINLQGQLTNLLVEKLASDAIEFDINYQPLNNHQHQISVTSLLMNWQDHMLNQVNFSSQGDITQQAIALAWQGHSSLDIKLNSGYKPANNQWQVTISKTEFSFGELFLHADQAVKLLYDEANNTLAINQHCWEAGESQLCLNNQATVNLTKGNMALALKLDAALISPFIAKDVQATGFVDGETNITWQKSTSNQPLCLPVAINLDSQLAVHQGAIQLTKNEKQYTLFAWQKGHLNLQLNNQTLSSDMVLFAPDGRQLVNINSGLSLADNQLIDSKINLNQFDIASLQVFIPELSLLEGKLNSQLIVKGDALKPSVNGNITLSDGQAKILGNINTLENMHLSVNFNGYQALVNAGVDMNNTPTKLSGELDWQQQLAGHFTVDGESVYIAVPPDVTLTVSPHLKADISASGLNLSGRIDVLDGKFLVNKLPQGSVSVSKDVIIVNDEGEQVINDKTFDIATNIRVLIKDTFKVEGQGFIGRIGGELQVNQQPRQPLQLFGSLRVPEGRYRAYGQDLSITKGNISFNGPVNNPHVAIQATRSIEKEDIVVGIDATGLANSLTIKLFSKPTMQQSDTLSYLVRGRGLDAETNDSNTALAVTLGSALTNFSGVLTQIEKLPLINRIEVEGDDKQASIAGYLGDQVYIKYGVGVLEPINELTVRFYFLSRLWVEAVSSLENSANIYYSFDVK